MLKQYRRAIIAVIIVNVLLVLFFVYINYTIWNYFNSNLNNNNDIGTIQMNPTWISGHIAGWLINGNFTPTGYFISTPNLPFWLFFVSNSNKSNLHNLFRINQRNETELFLENKPFPAMRCTHSA